MIGSVAYSSSTVLLLEYFQETSNLDIFSAHVQSAEISICLKLTLLSCTNHKYAEKSKLCCWASKLSSPAIKNLGSQLDISIQTVLSEAVDLCSLLLVLSLLYRAYLSHRWSYEEVHRLELSHAEGVFRSRLTMPGERWNHWAYYGWWLIKITNWRDFLKLNTSSLLVEFTH